jgi:hypothetical protein
MTPLSLHPHILEQSTHSQRSRELYGRRATRLKDPFTCMLILDGSLAVHNLRIPYPTTILRPDLALPSFEIVESKFKSQLPAIAYLARQKTFTSGDPF